MKEDKDKEKNAFEERRINSWEDIRASSKVPIELSHLFEKNNNKTDQRILILGRAGIGKVLCANTSLINGQMASFGRKSSISFFGFL